MVVDVAAGGVHVKVRSPGAAERSDDQMCDPDGNQKGLDRSLGLRVSVLWEDSPIVSNLVLLSYQTAQTISKMSLVIHDHKQEIGARVDLDHTEDDDRRGLGEVGL